LCLEYTIDECEKESAHSAFIGLESGELKHHDMRDFERMVNLEFQRPKEQWWLQLRGIASLLAQPDPAV